MANYFWLPYYDKTWDGFLSSKTGVRYNAKILPLSNGDSIPPGHVNLWQPGSWKDIANGDYLQIATHGRKYTTRSVAWACPAGIITWTAEQMAYVIEGFVGPRTIKYELLACFGANGWGLAESFGGLLRDEMRRLKMRGELTALKGATNIGAGQGHQTGSSRFSTAIKMLRKGGTDPTGPLTCESKVSWPLYEG